MSTPGGGQQKRSKTINPSRLQVMMSREEQDFVDAHPKSAALYARAQKSLLGGVPMNWMKNGLESSRFSSRKRMARISKMLTATNMLIYASGTPAR